MVARHRPIVLAVALVLVASLAACSKDKGTTATADLDSLSVSPRSVTLASGGLRYTIDVQAIFSSRCALSGCRSDDSRSGGLSLASFEGVASGGSFSGDVVLPGRPDQSRLIQRVESSEPSFRMPRGGPEISTPEKETLRSWVLSGLVQFRATGHSGGDTVAVTPSWRSSPGGRVAAGGLFSPEAVSGDVSVTATARGAEAVARVTLAP